MAGVDPVRMWSSQPIKLGGVKDLSALKLDGLPRPVGVFVTLETFLRPVHRQLERHKLLSTGEAKIIVAGSTPYYVADLQPAPQRISLDVPGIIGIAVDRLIHKAVQLPAGALTFLTSPRLLD